MKKIKVVICCGTYCHVLGGADLQSIVEDFPDELLSHVDCSFSTCLDLCREDYGKPPFALVNGCCIPEASKEKILNEVRKQLKLAKHDS